MKIKIAITLICILITACYMDYQEEIAVIKNNSTKSVIVIERIDGEMNDSIFNNQQFLKDTLLPKKSITLFWPNIRPSSAPDSIKDYIFIYDLGIIESLKDNNKIQEVHKKALLKQLTIQLNKIKYPLDTIIIK